VPDKVVATPKTLTYGTYSLNLKVEKGCRNFAWGNCTCFVAKYKNVTWRGNAKQWLKNAQKAGAATGQDPQPGAIIVYDGP
jgi:surface antigen